MSEITPIQWCDSTVNPIMGCAGCELFPKPSNILTATDASIKAVDGSWQDQGSKSLFTELINTAYTKLEDPSEHHSNEVTTTNIYHFRNDFAQAVKKKTNKEAAEAARKVIAEKITCYASKLHLHKTYSIKNPKKQANKGYAPTFETVTQYPGRLKETAALPDLLGRSNSAEPWKVALPRMIFVSDMGDAFSSKDDFDFLEKNVIPHITSKQGRKHLWLWLTKRPHLMDEFSKRIGGFPDNVCAMTTMTSGDKLNQKRLRDLKEVKASIKGLSVEPLWEDIKEEDFPLDGIDWVIVGGESGSGDDTHGFQLEWANNLRDICKKHDVAYFLKQLGRKPSYEGKALKLKHEHGGDWDEWPEGHKDREFPKAFHDYRKDEMVALPALRPSSVKLSKALSEDEKTQLTKLETTIKEGMTTFLKVGQAIYEIKEKKLYREQYDTFADYCEQELGISRQHANRHASAYKTKQLVDPLLKQHGFKEATNERQLREFGRLKKQEDMAEVIDIIAEEVKDNGDKGDAKDIPFKRLHEEAEKRSPKNKASAPPPQPNTDEDEAPSNTAATDTAREEAPPIGDLKVPEDLGVFDDIEKALNADDPEVRQSAEFKMQLKDAISLLDKQKIDEAMEVVQLVLDAYTAPSKAA